MTEPQRFMEHSLPEVIQEDIQADLRGAPGQWDVGCGHKAQLHWE